MPGSVVEPGFTPLFNEASQAGWHAVPRVYGPVWPGGPSVEELIPDFAADYDKLARARCGVGGGRRGDRRPAESGAAGVWRLSGVGRGVRRLRAGARDEAGLASRHRRHDPSPPQRVGRASLTDTDTQ